MTAITTLHRNSESHWIDLTNPVDTEFARRSATYLASLGYRPDEIVTVLVEEIDLSVNVALSIVESIHPSTGC